MGRKVDRHLLRFRYRWPNRRPVRYRRRKTLKRSEPIRVGWDNTWDNGVNYGWAMPQLYLEAGYGDLSVKAGHFYTIIGYEVVQATGNFFYSHAYTFNNSEPFTHTGILATYNLSDDVTFYGGWTEGWDSGFDDNGDNFLGGISVNLTDDFTVIYATTIGRFGSARVQRQCARVT